MIASADNFPSGAGDTHGKAVAYLVACGLSPAKAAACVASIAAQPGSPGGTADPTPAIMDAVNRWAREIGSPGTGEVPPGEGVRDRARMLLAAVPARWPGQVLRGPAPPALQAALDRVGLESTPDVRQTSMTAQPLDLGPLSDMADSTWRTFDKWPVLRGIAMWTLFLALLVVALFTVRF